MNKALGMKKCEVLIGDAEIKNNIRIQSLRDDIVYVDVAQRDRLRELDEEVCQYEQKCNSSTTKGLRK